MNNRTALYIPEDIHNQVMALVNGCDIEISWLGQLKMHKEGYIVTKIHVPEQECTSTTTEMDASSIGKIEYECISKYPEHGQLMWWGHSHVNMPASWSQQDLSTIEEHGRDGAKMIATVFNRKGDRRTAYIQGKSDNCIRVFADNLNSIVVPSELTTNRISMVKDKPLPKYNASRKQINNINDNSILEGHHFKQWDMSMFRQEDKKENVGANEYVKNYILTNEVRLDNYSIEEVVADMVEELDECNLPCVSTEWEHWIDTNIGYYL